MEQEEQILSQRLQEVHSTLMANEVQHKREQVRIAALEDENSRFKARIAELESKVQERGKSPLRHNDTSQAISPIKPGQVLLTQEQAAVANALIELSLRVECRQCRRLIKTNEFYAHVQAAAKTGVCSYSDAKSPSVRQSEDCTLIGGPSSRAFGRDSQA